MAEKEKKEKLKIIGMYQLKQKKYVHLGFTGKWKDSYGDATAGFLAIFYGDSGSGKTEAAVQFAKYLVQFGKVVYLSFEQRDRSTIRTSFERNGLLEMNKKVFLSPGGTFEKIVAYLKRGKSPQFVFIDSVDYSKLSFEQVTQLREMFPKKSFIFVAHGRGSIPSRSVAQEIRFDADMKIHVKRYVAFPDSRFEGGNDHFIVYEKMARLHHPHLFTEVDKPPKRVRKPRVKKEKVTQPVTPEINNDQPN